MQAEKNLIALVTGANTGIGYQIAKALAENNYTVYLGARNADKGKAAAKSLGGQVKSIFIDVTEHDSVQQAAEEIRKEHGRLDLLVNNAAISNVGHANGNVMEVLARQMPSVVSIDEMRTVWETNVFGVVAVTQAFLPLLHEAPAPRIVNVSSGLGSLTLNMDPSNPFRKGFDAVYAASKSAMNAITVSLAIELEGKVRVNAVSPGFTATALNNFQGTDTVEEGSKEPIRVALDEEITSGNFTGPDQTVYPW